MHESVLATVARWCDGEVPFLAVHEARQVLYERRAAYEPAANPDATPDVLEGPVWEPQCIDLARREPITVQ